MSLLNTFGESVTETLADTAAATSDGVSRLMEKVLDYTHPVYGRLFQRVHVPNPEAYILVGKTLIFFGGFLAGVELFRYRKSKKELLALTAPDKGPSLGSGLDQALGMTTGTGVGARTGTRAEFASLGQVVPGTVAVLDIAEAWPVPPSALASAQAAASGAVPLGSQAMQPAMVAGVGTGSAGGIGQGPAGVGGWDVVGSQVPMGQAPRQKGMQRGQPEMQVGMQAGMQVGKQAGMGKSDLYRALPSLEEWNGMPRNMYPSVPGAVVQNVQGTMGQTPGDWGMEPQQLPQQTQQPGQQVWVQQGPLGQQRLQQRGPLMPPLSDLQKEQIRRMDAIKEQQEGHALWGAVGDGRDAGPYLQQQLEREEFEAKWVILEQQARAKGSGGMGILSGRGQPSGLGGIETKGGLDQFGQDSSYPYGPTYPINMNVYAMQQPAVDQLQPQVQGKGLLDRNVPWNQYGQPQQVYGRQIPGNVPMGQYGGTIQQQQLGGQGPDWDTMRRQAPGIDEETSQGAYPLINKHDLLLKNLQGQTQGQTQGQFQRQAVLSGVLQSPPKMTGAIGMPGQTSAHGVPSGSTYQPSPSFQLPVASPIAPYLAPKSTTEVWNPEYSHRTRLLDSMRWKRGPPYPKRELTSREVSPPKPRDLMQPAGLQSGALYDAGTGLGGSFRDDVTSNIQSMVERDKQRAFGQRQGAGQGLYMATEPGGRMSGITGAGMSAQNVPPSGLSEQALYSSMLSGGLPMGFPLTRPNEGLASKGERDLTINQRGSRQMGGTMSAGSQLSAGQLGSSPLMSGHLGVSQLGSSQPTLPTRSELFGQSGDVVPTRRWKQHGSSPKPYPPPVSNQQPAQQMSDTNSQTPYQIPSQLLASGLASMQSTQGPSSSAPLSSLSSPSLTSSAQSGRNPSASQSSLDSASTGRQSFAPPVLPTLSHVGELASTPEYTRLPSSPLPPPIPPVPASLLYPSQRMPASQWQGLGSAETPPGQTSGKQLWPGNMNTKPSMTQGGKTGAGGTNGLMQRSQLGHFEGSYEKGAHPHPENNPYLSYQGEWADVPRSEVPGFHGDTGDDIRASPP